MDFILVGRVLVLYLLPTLKINRVATIYKTLGCLKFKHIMPCSDFYSLHCICSTEKVSSHGRTWARWREDIVCKKTFVFTLAPVIRAPQVGAPKYPSTAPVLPRLTWQCWVSWCLGKHGGRTERTTSACHSMSNWRNQGIPLFKGIATFPLTQKLHLVLVVQRREAQDQENSPMTTETTTSSSFSFFRSLQYCEHVTCKS